MRASGAGGRERERSREPLSPTRRLVAPRGRRASRRPLRPDARRRRQQRWETRVGYPGLRSSRTFARDRLLARARARPALCNRDAARPRRAFKWKRKVNVPIKAAFGARSVHPARGKIGRNIIYVGGAIPIGRRRVV